jgi:hypothetical protein
MRFLSIVVTRPGGFFYASAPEMTPEEAFCRTLHHCSELQRKRSNARMNAKTERLKRQLEGEILTRGARQAAGIELARLFDHAKYALARNQHVVSDDLVRIDNKRPALAGANGSISLRALLPELLGSDARVYRAPAPSAPAGEQHTLDMALMQNSRVMRAGAHLLVMPDAMEPVSDLNNTLVGFRNEPVAMVNINPASVDALTLDVNDEGTAQALPIAEAAIDPDGWTQRAVRFELNRSQIKAKGLDELTAEMMTAIALGIGRAADEELLTAISATTPGAYSLASVAAAGLRFDELRAIVGTAAAGVAVTDDGRLNVSGVPAELTPDMAETIVGAFDRAALAVSPEISVLVERTSANGSMAVTCWVDMQALLPEPGKFWSVA